MGKNNYINAEEEKYLEKILKVLDKEVLDEKQKLKGKLTTFREAGKEMWETGSLIDGSELNQLRQELRVRNKDYITSVQQIDRYEKMKKSPYFGRFDFLEEGYDSEDKIYLGIYSLIDTSTDDILVYDWRAPICNLYYRNEIGPASYKSPYGNIQGELLFKRQYKIQDSALKFFFDSSVKINDEALQLVLSQNASPKMRSIVETIQKEQDVIIRDLENELLIVQGVAGSGKTSIALHRIAFLLYQGLNLKLSSNNVVIISPNAIFSNYISDVLPELGEEVVQQFTYRDLIKKVIKDEYDNESRESQLEYLIENQSVEGGKLRRASIEFKGSKEFVKILNRYLKYYERKVIDFKDVYYDGKIIYKKQELKNSFLNNKIGMPMAKRLTRMENIIMDKIHPLSRARVKKIEQIVEKCDNHRLEVKLYSRALSMKLNKVFVNKLRSFTKVDYKEIYKALFSVEGLIKKLSKGINLPENLDSIVEYTNRKLKEEIVSYEDSCSLLYLKLKIEGAEGFNDIKQVVVDEAQDYYPIQYETFKLLFSRARYTVLGDFNQSLERKGSREYYNTIEKALNKNKTIVLFLNKSYRASFEINEFTHKLLEKDNEVVFFERYERKPRIVYRENKVLMNLWILETIKDFKSAGYESIAIISKNLKDGKELMEELDASIDITLYSGEDTEFKKGVAIIPCYLAKGMEFDAVIIYDVSREKYNTELDKRLLYVGCTRAMHELALCYTGEVSAIARKCFSDFE